ncbi:hypothetical protein ZWY2020_010143 [Hordeum vulgare]|nr:hypothetical protein ZWY2020_010143 [Hordeum vulgare]
MEIEAPPPPAAPSLCLPRPSRRWADRVEDSDDDDVDLASMSGGEGRVELPVSLAHPQLGQFLDAAIPARRRPGKAPRRRDSALRLGRAGPRDPHRPSPALPPRPSVAHAGLLFGLSSTTAAGGGARGVKYF